MLDLLIELPAVPVLGEITPRVSNVKPTSPGRSLMAGVQLGDAPDKILDTALELLERPPSDLATVARAATSRLIGEAVQAGAEDVAAIVALRQVVGLIDQRDPAAAFDVTRAMLRHPINDSARIALLDVATDLAMSAGELDLALQYASEIARLAQRITEATPTTQSQRDLSISLNKVGDMLAALGDPTAALDHYRRSLQITEATPTPQSRRDLSIGHEKVGDMLAALGDPTTALDHYRRSLDLREQLAEVIPTPQTERDLSISLRMVAGALDAVGDPASAQTYRQRAEQLSDYTDG